MSFAIGEARRQHAACDCISCSVQCIPPTAMWIGGGHFGPANTTRLVVNYRASLFVLCPAVYGSFTASNWGGLLQLYMCV